MQVTCLVLVLPRVVARGGAEKGAGKGRHKLRGQRRVGTENSENILLILHFYYSRWLGIQKINTRKQTQ